MADTINVVTENEFPLQYLDKGQLTGPSYSVVKETLALAGYPYQISVLPWSRAYSEALNIPNTLIFSIVRTEQREPLFRWVGEIHALDYGLIKLKRRTDLKFTDLTALGNNRIGVIRDSAIHIYLKNLGIDYNLIVLKNEKPAYSVLLKERVEFMPRNLLTMPFDCLEMAMDCDQFEVVHKLEHFTRGFYLAMSKSTSDEVFSNVQTAFESLRQQGRINALMKDTYNIQANMQFKPRQKE